MTTKCHPIPECIDANPWIPVHTGVRMRCPLLKDCLIVKELQQGVTILSYTPSILLRPDKTIIRQSSYDKNNSQHCGYALGFKG